jgi:hypothetical protein
MPSSNYDARLYGHNSDFSDVWQGKKEKDEK